MLSEPRSDLPAPSEDARALSAALEEHIRTAIEGAGGHVSIGRFEGAVTITAELPAAAEEIAPNVVQLERAPVPPDNDATAADMLDFGPDSDDREPGSGADAA